MTASSAAEPSSPVAIAAEGEVTIVVLTHNRVHLLARCVENVPQTTPRATREIVIWNNGSEDATAGLRANAYFGWFQPPLRSDSRGTAVDPDDARRSEASGR